jgi:hypothetical protein
MAAAEHRVGGLVERGAGLTAGELSLVWDLAMRLPRCHSVPHAEAVVFQATAGIDQTSALQQAIAETVAAAIDAIRDRQRLHDLAICDTLTGLYNRRFLEEELARQIHHMTRIGRPIFRRMVSPASRS